MKRLKQTVLLLLPAVALLLHAGEAAALVETGLSVGMNFASLSDVNVGDASSTYESKTGWHFGIFAKSALGPLGVRAGAVYLDAGPLFEGLSDKLDDPSLLKDDFDVRFFVIPVDFQYRLVTPVVKPYLFAGPELRFNVTSSDQFEDNFKNTQWGGNIGAGVEFGLPILDIRLTPEFRYSFDLTSLTNDTITIDGNTIPLSDSFDAGTYHLRLHVAF